MMTMIVQKKAPNTSWKALKKSVFNGDILVLPPSYTSLKLVEDIKALFKKYNNYDLSPTIHKEKSYQEIINDSFKLKETLLDKDLSSHYIRPVINEFDDLDQDLLCDYLRFRAMPDRAHLNGLRPSALTIHRDCWYSNPQAQINFWIPIFDVEPNRAFHFYPDYFDRPVKNSSHQFNYDQWKNAVGFQNNQNKALSQYPIPTEDLTRAKQSSFSAKAGSMIVFSASQLHAGTANESGLSRFSLDFRVVSKTDIEEKCGAPNVDNYSNGYAHKDYFLI